MTFPNPKQIIFLIIILIVLSGLIYFSQSEKSSCPIQTKKEIVRGSSMEPLIKSGYEITALYGYYDCQPIKRNDIVLVKYAGNQDPLIKVVKAIPEDKWELNENKEKNTFEIIVNGQALKNSQGAIYQIPSSKIKVLQLYQKDYPIIPENTYLVMGNLVSGSMDATKFGLIDKSSILAKVEF